MWAQSKAARTVRSFFTDELWPSSTPGRRASLKDWGKFVGIVFRGFNQNRCLIRAAALTYTTLLALVPLLAVVLGVSKAVLATQEDKLFEFCMDFIQRVAPQIGQAAIEQQAELREKLHDALSAVSAGKLGLFGSFMLVITSVSLFSTIERALNDIWGVPRGRSPLMKVVFYWSTLTLGSIVVFFAIGATSVVKMPAVLTQLAKLKLDVVTPLLRLIPFLVLWVGFGMLYRMMPNTHVDLRSALLGGIVAGTLWQVNNYLNVLYVSKVVSANKLYGSLGMVPIFMFGLYVAWVFVLLGAQVAYTFQNASVLAKEKEEESDNPNQSSKELIALRAMLLIARQFLNAELPMTSTEISTRIGAPLHLVNQIVQRMCDAKLLVEIAGNSATFEPARPIEKITAYDVLRAMRELDGKPQETTQDDDDRLIRSLVERVEASAAAPARSFDFRALADGKEPAP